MKCWNIRLWKGSFYTRVGGRRHDKEPFQGYIPMIGGSKEPSYIKDLNERLYSTLRAKASSLFRW